MSGDLENFRQQIDALDVELMETLDRRIRVIEQVGTYKAAHGVPALDEARWQRLMAARLELARSHNLSEEFITKLYDMMHEYTLQIERQAGAP